MAYLNSELLVQQWLKSLSMDVSGVSTALPGDYNAWGAKPFVVVESVLAPNYDANTTQRQPVIGLGIYAVKLEGGGISSKPPYAKAAEAAEAIVRATEAYAFDIDADEVPLTLPSGYEAGYIQQVNTVNLPRRRPGDQGSYAIFDMTIQIFWTAAIPQ